MANSVDTDKQSYLGLHCEKWKKFKTITVDDVYIKKSSWATLWQNQ